jgi:4-oxalocrotonate tautomerase
MAFVEVHLVEGRTLEQKRALTGAITEALVSHANANPEYIHVVLTEYSRENWARSGELLSDL